MSDLHARRRNTERGTTSTLETPLNLSLASSEKSDVVLLRKSFNRRNVAVISVFCLFLVLLGRSSPGEPARAQAKGVITNQVKAADDRSLEQHSIAQETRSIIHIRVNSTNAMGSGSKNPVILQGWARPEEWTESKFLDKVGHYQQYLKDASVQPMKDRDGQQCKLPGSQIVRLIKQAPDQELLFFTNNKENEAFMNDLSSAYQVPDALQHITGFQVFSMVPKGRSHSFHKHGESWLGQVEGRRAWWFLPPSAAKPVRINACNYLNGTAEPPAGTLTCIQEPGDIVWFPTDWYHATCALDDWTVGIGAQQGPLIRQQFGVLDQTKAITSDEIKETIRSCVGPEFATLDEKSSNDWTWFDGDLNAYYNNLEKDHNRNPEKISSYAVHRWMGQKRSTEEHYHLLDSAITKYHERSDSALRVFDGGCGLGSGLMWMELKHPNWALTGHTVSEEQYKFISTKLPAHKFQVNLRSYNELDDNFDFMYSIEALIHSPNVTETFQEWASHLNDGGVIAIIDDFLSMTASKLDDEVVAFAKSWLANSLFTTVELVDIGVKFGLEVVEIRDLGEEYQINELNYKNKMPDITPDKGRTHQGWMGSKWRQRLTLEGKITYNMVILQKVGQTSRNLSDIAPLSNSQDDGCSVVPSRVSVDDGISFTEITPQLMSGQGKNGGAKMECISSWYCCNKGHEWYDNLEANRTDDTAYLKLPRDLFGHYITSFAKHLNAHYKTYPENAKGRFLDIGGTGSTASGMKQVTSKFQHFAGPLEYWILDSDPGAKALERTLHCDIDDCPAAETCGFDVTFSHTVLEHATRPWKSFDTIARLTKKGGLTMHLVPFSYQYHATPDDNYRFSHKALISLLEDRGFTVLEVGYDICTKPAKMLRKVDEHYDTIWLTYVIGRKN
jgi:cyclopropane fatty-acyl-phospholipid synthase-like methyltransferase/SAM-dependent methyltransferase